MKEIFEINLKNRFEKLEEEVTARSFSEIMKEEANKLAGKTKEEAPVLSTEDQEIKQLEDRRKELRKKEDRPQREKIEYTELSKTLIIIIINNYCICKAQTLDKVNSKRTANQSKTHTHTHTHLKTRTHTRHEAYSGGSGR